MGAGTKVNRKIVLHANEARCAVVVNDCRRWAESDEVIIEDQRKNALIRSPATRVLGRIGADRAAYTTLLFPIVALALSMMFEGYRGNVGTMAGVILILAGNFMVLKRQEVGRGNRE